jgi:hypothetical protein
MNAQSPGWFVVTLFFASAAWGDCRQFADPEWFIRGWNFLLPRVDIAPPSKDTCNLVYNAARPTGIHSIKDETVEPAAPMSQAQAAGITIGRDEILIATIKSLALAGAATIGTFKQWTAYTSSDADGKICFVAAQPTDTKYAPSKPGARNSAYFIVTNFPRKKTVNEVSTIIGYIFKKDSKVTIDVEGKKFTMFTDKDNAWIEDQTQEGTLIRAMRAARTMTIRGISTFGITTTDTYSLAGLGPALDAIAAECPIL